MRQQGRETSPELMDTKTIGLLVGLSVILIAGCSAITMPGKPTGMMADTDMLNSLLSQDRQVVYKKIGLPVEEYMLNGTHYLLYATKSDAVTVGLILYVPVFASKEEKTVIHCLRLNIDADNIVKEYEIKSAGQEEFMFTVTYPSCKSLFWEDNELQSLQRVPVLRHVDNPSDYLSRLSLGDVGAITDPKLQYELYMLGVDDKLEWLCKSAIQNHPPALREIGDIFYYGWYSKAVNYQLAYRWYRYARMHGAYDAEQQLNKTYYKVTKTFVVEEHKKQLDWSDTQCAKDLLMPNVE